MLTDGWGRFVAPTGIDEYGVLYLGFERLESEPSPSGHFRFTHRLDGVRAGSSIAARGAVFQQRGNRDFIKVRGEWLQSSSPYEEPDRLIASDEVTLDVYQVRVSLEIPRPPLDLDIGTGILRIQRDDGTSTTLYVDRPGRPGFTIVGPEPNGRYEITYEPSGDELNRTGTTAVRFSVLDVGGQRHEAQAVLETP